MPGHGPKALDHDSAHPEEVTDPLLWKLALGVADAHGPDDDGGCRNLACAGQSWPCTAWNTAQHALQVARADTGTAPGASPDPRQRSDDDSPVGWSTVLSPPATRLPSTPDRSPEVAAPAA